MQLEKNKSRWLRRWWMDTIAQQQHNHEQEKENRRSDSVNIHGAKAFTPEGAKFTTNETGRIAFARAETPKRSYQLSEKLSPKQQLSEALQGYRARVNGWQVELSNKSPMQLSIPSSPDRNNKRPSPFNNSGVPDTYADERPRKRIKRERSSEVSSPVPQEQHEPTAPELKENVQKVLATAGVSPDSIIRLINNEEERSEIIKQTGFSNNYIMKLQRKVLRSAAGLQLKNPDVYTIGDAEVHVLFDSNNTPLFIKKELCELLSMKGTTFSYWKKKSNVEELDTSQDFRLMDQCRTIFGGRSTYTLYTVDATLAILTRMESSRQRGIFRATALQELIDIARSYGEKMDSEVSDDTEDEEEEEEALPRRPATSVAVKAEKAATPANC